jgi:hypothetical protein
MWLRRIIFFALLSIASDATAVDLDCVDWFSRNKLESGSKNCELKCAVLMTDMATFMCPSQCNKLCKPKEEESLLSQLVFYPGLTQAEKKFVVKNPNQAYSVYKLKGRAEDATARNFPNQDLNDESDAFRHFVWSGLLTKELGRQKAQEYLDAHEANPLQSDRERQMDTFNNERGQSAAETLLKNNKWNEKALEAKAIEELHNKNLVVISPGLPTPKEAK